MTPITPSNIVDEFENRCQHYSVSTVWILGKALYTLIISQETISKFDELVSWFRHDTAPVVILRKNFEVANFEV
jgi:hypothetical protein